MESLRELAKMYSTSTSSNGTSTMFNCLLSEDPQSDSGILWLKSTRKKLKALEDSGAFQDFQMVLEGGAGVAHDATTAVHQSSLAMIGIVVSVVIFFIAFFLRSLTTPLRSVLTIIFTLRK